IFERGVDVFEVRHADDLAVTAEWNRFQSVLGLAPTRRPQPRTEADEKFGDEHPAALRQCEVAELVQEDHQRIREDHRDERDLRREEQRVREEQHHTDDRVEHRPAGAHMDIVERIPDPQLLLLRSIATDAYSRARWSAWRTSETSSAFPVPLSSVSSTTA